MKVLDELRKYREIFMGRDPMPDENGVEACDIAIAEIERLREFEKAYVQSLEDAFQLDDLNGALYYEWQEALALFNGETEDDTAEAI